MHDQRQPLHLPLYASTNATSQQATGREMTPGRGQPATTRPIPALTLKPYVTTAS